MDFSFVRKKLAESQLPIYETVIRTIREAIESGELPPGFRLPSDKELAAEFGISHVTLGRALNELRALGLLKRWRALGTFVKESLPDKMERRRNIAIVFDFANAITFHQESFLELHKKLDEAGLTLLFFSSGGSSTKQLTQLKSIVCDTSLKGCIFWSILNPEQARELIQKTPSYFPLVFMDKIYPDLRHDAATYDNFVSARKLGGFLRKKAQSITWVFSEDQEVLGSTTDRFNGLCEGFGPHVRKCRLSEMPGSGTPSGCLVFSSEAIYDEYRTNFGEPKEAYAFASRDGYPGIRFDVRSMADAAVSILLRRLNGDDAPFIHLTSKWTLNRNAIAPAPTSFGSGAHSRRSTPCEEL